MTRARVNECMVRTGLLVGLSSGLAMLGHWQVAGVIGVFATVQILNLVAQAMERTRASKA